MCIAECLIDKLAYRLTRYSEILDFHNIDQSNEAGQALVEGPVQGDFGQAFT
jgi:p38 MAP kinase